MDKKTLFKELNEGLLKERYGAFKRNLLKNLDYINHFGGLKRIVPELNKKNVIVAGAGPSLENGLALLKKYQHRDEIEIIAADMALIPLVKAGITPHYVISCETVPVDFFNNVPAERIHLLAFSCSAINNLRRWKGDMSFYNWMIHTPLYDELWETAGLDLGYVATGNLVTTQAVSLALGCNIESLLIVGNDLAFNNRYYTRGTAPFLKRFNLTGRFGTIETIEYDTNRNAREFVINRENMAYYTTKQFLAAKLWLEELFVKQTVPIFDSSDPGCSEKYVNKIELKRYFERFEKRKRKRRKLT